MPDLNEEAQRLHGESIGALFSRLIDRAGDFIRAEIAFYKEAVARKLNQAKLSVVLGIVAVMIVQASLTVLLVALGLGVAHWIGLAGGVAVAGLLGLAAAGLCVYLAILRIKSVPGGAELPSSRSAPETIP